MMSTLYLLTGQLNSKGTCFLLARNFNKLDLMLNGVQGYRVQCHDKSCFVNLLSKLHGARHMLMFMKPTVSKIKICMRRVKTGLVWMSLFLE